METSKTTEDILKGLREPMWKSGISEIDFWREAIRILKEGYGADCLTKDTDDLYERPDGTLAKEAGMTEKTRCQSCRAREVITFLEDHIELLKMDL